MTKTPLLSLTALAMAFGVIQTGFYIHADGQRAEARRDRDDARATVLYLLGERDKEKADHVEAKIQSHGAAARVNGHNIVCIFDRKKAGYIDAVTIYVDNKEVPPGAPQSWFDDVESAFAEAKAIEPVDAAGSPP